MSAVAAIAIERRIRDAGALLGIETNAMLSHVVEVTGTPLAHPIVYVDGELRTIGTAVGLAGDDVWLARRAASLAHTIGASTMLARLAMARTGQVSIERSAGEQRRAALAVVGPATLEADLAVAAALGMSASACQAAGDKLGAFGGGGSAHRTMRATIFAGPPSPEPAILELGVLLEGDITAKLAGVDPAQGAVLDSIGPSGAPFGRVAFAVGELADGFTLGYASQPIELASRAFAKIATSAGAAARFEELARTLGATRVAALELTFGAHLTLRVGMPVSDQ